MSHHRAHSQQNGNAKARIQRPPSSGPLTPNEKPNMGMSPTSRYDHNLKVLRRRDPSITSIFDQFSHVCVYHFNIRTEKWEKLGYEGSMFLYERNEYPPYGFYVLNRAGMSDYIQRMYPDDDIGEVGGYFMTRSYPEYTSRRLAHIRDENPADSALPYSDIWCFPEPRPTKEFKESQSTFKTTGLWVFASDAREPLTDVMKRLYEYIKKNERYPDEYRYGPGRPPPPNPHLRTAEQSTKPASSTPEFNNLLAKLNSSATNKPPHQTPSRMSMTVESLFASIGKTPRLNGTSAAVVVNTPPPPSTGIPLLDSILASAASPSLQPPSHPEPVIYSPKPSVSALPQILNQDVITTLLGLPSSRSSSSNSFSSSREADCEDLSDTSTALDLDAEPDAAGASAGRPLMSREFSQEFVKRAPVNGDVTPRAPAAPPRTGPAPTNRPPSAPVQALLVPLNDNSNGRRLVPFDDADTSLWPYPRAPIDEEEEELVELDFQDTSALSDAEKFRREEIKSKRRLADEGTSESEVGKKGKKGKGSKAEKKRKERENIEKSWDVPAALAVSQPPPPPPPPPPPAQAPAVPATAIPATPTTAKPLNGKGKAKANGHLPPPATDGLVDSIAVKESILNTVRPTRVHVERNEFVREVLTLIHTDKTFVDSLWQDYLNRTN